MRYARSVVNSPGSLDLQVLPDLARAGVGAFSLRTDEERRALEELEAHAEALDLELRIWSVAGVDGGPRRPLAELLREISSSAPPALWVVLDAQAAFKDPLVLRLAREQAQQASGPGRPIVVYLSHDTSDPASFPEALSLRLRRPTADQVLEEAPASLWPEREVAPWIDHAAQRQLAQQCVGLGRDAAHRALHFAIDGGADLSTVRARLQRIKSAMLTDRGLLDPVSSIPADELGGLPRLKAWLQRRAHAMGADAAAAAVPPPRGVLLVGVQGCGKSRAARAAGALLETPTVRLDLGRLFQSGLGDTERHLRETLDTVERLAPVVLWLDEVDKSLSERGSGGDAGTSARVMASLLTWMQERTSPVFVVATANDIDRLPPELIRRGRLDETFFVGLPDQEARVEILRAHLERGPRRQLGAAPPLADPVGAFDEEARQAHGYTGAELEAALSEARLEAFIEGHPVRAVDLREALAATVPMSRSHAERVEALERWAATRARPA